MKRFFFTLFTVFFSFLNLHAQNEDSLLIDELWNMSLADLMNQEISGVSRYKQSSSDVPNSIQVFSKQQIADRGYKDLSDLLKDIPGIDITSNAGRFGEFYSFRGIGGNDRFLVLINGHKLNPASGTFLSVGNSISIRYAERVEVIYGSASAVYGADAFSGIINIVFKDFDIENKISASGYSDYGSQNTQDFGFSTSMNLNDNLSFNLNARKYTSDGFDVLGTQPIYDIIETYDPPTPNECKQPINDNNIYFNLNYKNISINYYRQQFDEGNALGHNPEMYIYDEENKWKTTTNMFWINYKKEFSGGGILAVDLSYKKHYQDENTLFHKLTSGTTTDSYRQYMTGKDNTILGAITYNQTFSEKFQFIAGLDNEYTQSIPPYANDEVLGSSEKYEGTNAELIDEALTIDENRVSLFSQFIYSPIEKLQFVFGARYDYSSYYDGVFNPRLAFSFEPSKKTKLRLLYGRAFQAPSLFYQYEQFGTPTVVMLSSIEVQKIRHDWKLKNQIVNSFEINLHHEISNNYSLKIAAYYNNLTDLIERNVFSNDVYNKYFDTNTEGLRNENIGSQEIYGFDFLLNAKLSKNILFYSYYSYTDAVTTTTEGAETNIPRIAEHKIWLGFTAQNLFKHLTISPRFRWSGEMYNANTEAFPNNTQDGYCTLDVNLSVNNLSEYFRIYANFENILDNEIYNGGLYGQSGIYTAVIPQQGFTFKIGIEFFLSK